MQSPVASSSSAPPQPSPTLFTILTAPVIALSSSAPVASPASVLGDVHNVTANAPRPQRPRLKGEGVKIMREFFDNVTPKPTPSQLEVIVEQIHALPGCADYTCERARLWFASHRQEVKKKQAAAQAKEKKPDITGTEKYRMSATLCKQFFPSFAGPITLRFIQELLSSDPNPSEEVIEIWATHVRADLQDVRDCITMILALRKERKPDISNENVPGKRQLPTPQTTPTPEPDNTAGSSSLQKLQLIADAIIEAQSQPMEVEGEPPEETATVTCMAEFEEQYNRIAPAFESLLEKMQAASEVLASLSVPQDAN